MGCLSLGCVDFLLNVHMAITLNKVRGGVCDQGLQAAVLRCVDGVATNALIPATAATAVQKELKALCSERARLQRVLRLLVQHRHSVPIKMFRVLGAVDDVRRCVSTSPQIQACIAAAALDQSVDILSCLATLENVDYLKMYLWHFAAKASPGNLPGGNALWNDAF